MFPNINYFSLNLNKHVNFKNESINYLNKSNKLNSEWDTNYNNKLFKFFNVLSIYLCLIIFTTSLNKSIIFVEAVSICSSPI